MTLFAVLRLLICRDSLALPPEDKTIVVERNYLESIHQIMLRKTAGSCRLFDSVVFLFFVIFQARGIQTHFEKV